MKQRLMIMDINKAKESLVDRYVIILRKGFPQGTVSPFKRWVAILAIESEVEPAALLEEIRHAALAKHRLQSNAS